MTTVGPSNAAISQLVTQLRGSSRVGQASALKTLATLAAVDGNCAAIRQAPGIMPALVARLGDSSATIQEGAARLVGLLAHGSSEGKEMALEAGAMQRLVELLRGSCGDGSPHASRHSMLRSGPGSRSSSSDSSSGAEIEGVRGQALLGIRNLVLGSCDCAAALQAAEGIGPVVHLLFSTAAASHQVQAAAAAILTQVPIGSQERTTAAITAGAFDALLPLLWSGSEEVRLQAAWACRNLCWGTPTNVMAAAEAGCIAPLLRLLSDSSSAVQEQAAAALCNLASYGERGAAALHEAGAAQTLVSLLHICDSSDGAGTDGGSASGHGSSGSSSDSKCKPDQQEDLACTAALALANIVGSGGRAAADDAVSAAGGMQQLQQLLQTHGGRRALQKAAPGLPPDADDPQSPAADAGPAASGDKRLAPERPGAQNGTQAAGMEVEQPAAAEAGRQPAHMTPPAPARPPAPKVCAAEGCGATTGLKRCGGCASVRYCSVACSRAHWPAHKAECRRLQAAAADGRALHK